MDFILFIFIVISLVLGIGIFIYGVLGLIKGKILALCPNNNWAKVEGKLARRWSLYYIFGGGFWIFYTIIRNYVLMMFTPLLWIFSIYLLLPLLLIKKLPSWLGSLHNQKLLLPFLVGLLMGFYTWLGSQLVIKHFLFWDTSLLAYSYTHLPFTLISTIAGAVSGFFLQFGIRLKTKVEAALFAGGVISILGIAAYAAFLVIAPE